MPFSARKRCGAAGRQNLEADIDQHADRRQDARLVVIADGDEDGALARQFDAGAELRLGEGQREIRVEADDFAGRAHFRAEQRVDAGEAGEREDRFLDGDVLQLARIGLLAIGGKGRVERLTGHDAGGDLGDRRADGLGDEGHRARGARVDFEHVDRAVLDGELHVHQAADVQRLGHRLRLPLEFIEHLDEQRARRQRAGASRRNGCRLPRYAP